MKVKIFISAVLGDGKSNDALCTRIRAQNRTLRLSRSCLISSDNSYSISSAPCWINTILLEHLIQSAFGIESTQKEEMWNLYLSSMESAQKRNLMEQYANRRKKICNNIVKKVFRNHCIKNAFFGINFLNPKFGIFGHTPTDIMHCLEEGIMSYVQNVILNPLPDSTCKELDHFINTIMKNNRQHGFDDFPRCKFSSGFSCLSFLSSEERVGRMLCLVIVLNTKKGKEILRSRFKHDFDINRRKMAKKFHKKVECNSDSDFEFDQNDQDVSDDDSETENDTGEHILGNRFQSNDLCWNFLKKQFETYGLQYVVTDVIPCFPDLHCWN